MGVQIRDKWQGVYIYKLQVSLTPESIDGMLPSPHVSKNYVRCKISSDLLMFFLEMPRRFRRTRAFYVIGLCVIFLLLLCGTVLTLHPAKRMTQREAVVELFKGVRPVEGRLAGLQYAPYSPGAPGISLRTRGSEVRPLIRKISGDPASSALLNLIDGDLESTVARLESSIEEDPSDAVGLADLSAIYLEQARKNGDSYDLVRALVSAEKAIRNDSDLDVAYFNRSLALENLHLLGEARRSWIEYLELDQISPWAEEGRKHLGHIESQFSWQIQGKATNLLQAWMREGGEDKWKELIRSFPQHARLFVEEDLLGMWGDALLASDNQKAYEFIERVRTSSRSPSWREDLFLVDSLEAIEAASSQHSELLGVAQAHSAMREGLKLYREDDFTTSRQFFERALRGFRSTGSPFSQLALYYIAVLDFYSAKHELSFDTLNLVLRHPRIAYYPYLRSRAELMQGLIRFVQDRPSDALGYYRQALIDADAAGEPVGAAYIHYLMARALERLGDTETGWKHRYYALAAHNKLVDQRRIYSILVDAAESLLEAEEAEVALKFQDELMEILSHWGKGKAALSMEAHLRRARTYSQLGEHEKANEDLRAANALISAVKDDSFRERVLADLVTSEALLSRDSLDKIEALGVAISYFKSKGLYFELSGLSRMRALEYMKIGRPNDAERDLFAAMRQIESARKQITTERLRVAHLDRAREIFDDLARFQIEWRRDYGAGFGWAERSRGWGIQDGDADELENAGEIPDERRILKEVRRDLPAGTGLIEYMLLPDRLIIWTLVKSKIRWHEVELDAADLERQIRRLVKNIWQEHGRDSIKKELARFHDLLLRPVLEDIGQVREIVIVPDRILHSIPFACLVDKATGRFFVQDYALTQMPSSHSYIKAVRKGASLGSQPSVLVVGNPAFDAKIFPNLTEVPASALEGRQIASLYREAHLLLGSAATKQKFWELASTVDVIHFGGHAAVSPYGSRFASLIFASRPGMAADAGVLGPEDISWGKLGKVKLIVLAACATGKGRLSSSEGPMSLARPFLKKVPAVLATLVPVDDYGNSELFVRFHDYLVKGYGGARALQAAQLELLGSDEDLLDWGGVYFMGYLKERRQNEPGNYF
jgi:CHAT domain-containing protein/tetratricopeptide (TPR) repeat protein